jgi:SAM-dependent methyltransferase
MGATAKAPIDGITAMNRRHAEDSDVVSHYLITTLLPAEIMIFVKYRDEISNRRVLDAACGVGSITRYLGRWTRHCTGIESTPALVERCRRTIPHIAFSLCDPYDLSQFPDGGFDFAFYGYNRVDMLGPQDRLNAFAEVRRVLSSGGLYVFSSHNRRFHEGRQGPHLRFSLNPVTLARNTLWFARSVPNHWKLKPLEREEPDYALVNDLGHYYCMLTYYIEREKQAAQLASSGFDLVEAFGEEGDVLPPGEDDSSNARIYYVARRR